jgi:hypothetical protein
MKNTFKVTNKKKVDLIVHIKFCYFYKEKKEKKRFTVL